MTWFAISSSSILILVIAGIMLLMPALTRPTIPLGVSVPRAHAADPVIADAVRSYRGWVVGALVVSLIVTVVLGLLSPATAILIPTLLMIVLWLAAYILARQRIQQAKTAGRWYQDVPVRITGSITPTAAMRAHIPAGWYIAALAVLVAAAAIGVSRYDTLPASIPVHWNGAGVADSFAAKSVWSVFGVLLGGAGTAIVMYLIAFAVRFTPARAMPQDTEEEAAARGLGVQHATQNVLGQLTLLIGLLFCGIALYGWLIPTVAWLPAVMTVVFIVLTALILVVYAVRFTRLFQAARITVPQTASRQADGTRPSAAQPSAGIRHDAPDDDNHWKAGVIYYNRNDPALMVPKRFGIGWTINVGHPAGLAILGATVLLIVASIVVTVLGGGIR